jgi:hypothetical protein
MSILTLLGNSLSLVALFVTFLIYVCIKELQTIPGKMMMNYITALAFSQLALQFNDDFVSYPYICKAVGVLQHHLWLVTFSWTNALAFRMYRTFKQGINSVPQKRLAPYVVYAWFSPGIITFPCLALDLTNTGWYQYGDDTSCWIYQIQPHLILGTFGCPMLLLVFTNVFFLVRCACMLHTAFTDVSDVHYMTRHQTLSVYIRLFILMGVTWLLGFLPSITGIDFFWYPFILINTLQGFFILLVFGVPKVVTKLGWCDNQKFSRNRHYRQ